MLHLDLGPLNRPILFFGGPYSNYQATEALLNIAQAKCFPMDHIICTGDVVAYAAQPNETANLIRESGIHTIKGNCEESLANGHLDCGCGFDSNMQCALMSVNWYGYAKHRVSAANKTWMRHLPHTLTFSLNGIRCSVVHGSIDHINEFIFPSSDATKKQAQLAKSGSHVMIAGHSGLPFGERLVSSDHTGLWLNSGVIGLPANDATTDGWYMVLTPEDTGVRASWHRLPYDYSTCQDYMQAANLLDYMDTMQSGLWPSMDVLPDAERSQQGQTLELDSLYFSPCA